MIDRVALLAVSFGISDLYITGYYPRLKTARLYHLQRSHIPRAWASCSTKKKKGAALSKSGSFSSERGCRNVVFCYIEPPEPISDGFINLPAPGDFSLPTSPGI